MSQKKSPRANGESAARGKARQRGAAQLGATRRNILRHREIARSKPLLTDRQRAAARLLAMGRRVGDVAAELALHRGTLLRWRKLRMFQDELARVQHCGLWNQFQGEALPSLAVQRFKNNPHSAATQEGLDAAAAEGHPDQGILLLLGVHTFLTRAPATRRRVQNLLR